MDDRHARITRSGAGGGTANNLLRLGALSVAILGTLFWLYTFYAIAQVPAGDGTGMQWLAIMPLGLIFCVFMLPALILAAVGRSLVLSVILGILGLAAFAIVWKQLLDEFAGS